MLDAIDANGDDAGDGTASDDASPDAAADSAPGDDASDGGGLPDAAPDAGSDAHLDAAADAPPPVDAGTDAPPVDAAPDAPPPPDELVIFVSSALYSGNLGGLSGADAKCQSLASAAGLTGTFKAWLSTTTTTASTRLTHGTKPYALVDHTVVANDWAGLTSGTLLHAINLTETGQAPTPGTLLCGNSSIPVWTYTNASGGKPGVTANCSNWTSTSDQFAYGGTANATTSDWTAHCSVSASTVCAETASLYCLQQ
jgi:hypothetical protein